MFLPAELTHARRRGQAQPLEQPISSSRASH